MPVSHRPRDWEGRRGEGRTLLLAQTTQKSGRFFVRGSAEPLAISTSAGEVLGPAKPFGLTSTGGRDERVA